MKLFSLILSLLLATTANAETLSGRVVSIADGDTVTMLDSSNTQHKIRLAQIDAPETGHGKNKPAQPYGEKSKAALSELVFQQTVEAQCQTKDRYGRLVCKILVNGTDANLEQVKNGWAWVYTKYARESSYFEAEATAKAKRIGLWADNEPVPPWEYRHPKQQ